MYFIDATFYIIFGSGSEQSWNRFDDPSSSEKEGCSSEINIPKYPNVDIPGNSITGIQLEPKNDVQITGTEIVTNEVIRKRIALSSVGPDNNVTGITSKGGQVNETFEEDTYF